MDYLTWTCLVLCFVTADLKVRSRAAKSLLFQEETCSELPAKFATTLLGNLTAFGVNNQGSGSMTALLCRQAGPRCSSWRCLGAVLRGTHTRASLLHYRDGARTLAGGSRPLTGHSRAHSRWQHTEAAEPVEVDLKRLEGGDDGRDALQCNSTLFKCTLMTNSSFS